MLTIIKQKRKNNQIHYKLHTKYLAKFVSDIFRKRKMFWNILHMCILFVNGII